MNPPVPILPARRQMSSASDPKGSRVHLARMLGTA